jgi:hypothetical protein
MSPGQQPLLQTLFNQRLTTTPCVRIHLDRIPRYLVQTPRVAVLGYSCELGLHLLHVRFHGDDRFGRIEETAVARTVCPSAQEFLVLTITPLLTPRATAASLDCRRHWRGAAVQACEP